MNTYFILHIAIFWLKTESNFQLKFQNLFKLNIAILVLKKCIDILKSWQILDIPNLLISNKSTASMLKSRCSNFQISNLEIGFIYEKKKHINKTEMTELFRILNFIQTQ